MAKQPDNSHDHDQGFFEPRLPVAGYVLLNLFVWLLAAGTSRPEVAAYTIYLALHAAEHPVLDEFRVAMLGFAGGGMVAPLRGMGGNHPLYGVDLSADAGPLFRGLSEGWGGGVHLDVEDAARWRGKRRGRFDAIVEDLSVPSPIGTVKPYVSFDSLPRVIRGRLAPGGVAITNVLPMPGTSWESMYARLALPYERVLAEDVDEFVNRIVIAGDELPDARTAGKLLRGALGRIESDMLRQMRMETVRFS